MVKLDEVGALETQLSTINRHQENRNLYYNRLTDFSFKELVSMEKTILDELSDLRVMSSFQLRILKSLQDTRRSILLMRLLANRGKAVNKQRDSEN